MPIRKIDAGRIITVESENWVGPTGTIWYDEVLADLRIGDNKTPGGRLISTGGVGIGLKGATGLTGATGPAGRDGIIGVDGATGPAGPNVTVSDTAPLSPLPGNLWWDNTVGKMFIYYNDGTSSQWVDATSTPVLSTATTTLLGGVKIGENINISQDGTISVMGMYWASDSW
jgi:hypothetical protein